jgi:hypothetical protein
MSKAKWWDHIAIWAALYGLWIAVFQNQALTLSRTMTVGFCYFIFIAANFYLHTYFSVPRFLYRSRYLAFVSMLLLGILAGAALRTGAAVYMNAHYFLPGKPQPYLGKVFLDSFINISFWVLSIIAVYLIIEKVRFRKYVATIEEEKTRNELNFLTAQFNPHFMFNSINSIYGQIDKQNSKARTMLLTFSDMLRYQLYECNVPLVDIDREIAYIKNYVAIQQSRKGENLVVDLDIEEDVRGFKIAPLLFIAFIENAFKYVSSDEKRENVVGISFGMEKEELLFKTYNTRERLNGHPIKHQGIGIKNVKRRLELLYADRYNLSIQNNEQVFEVELKIKVQ